MKVEPRFISYYDNRYHALLSGQLKIEIKTDQIQSTLTDYNIFHINDLEMDYNSKISLRWQIDDSLYSTPLNHNPNSLTFIDFKTDDATKIQDLHLLLESDFELNNEAHQPKTVTFSAFSLDHEMNHNHTKLSLSQWLSFNPVEVNSINGYSNSKSLNLHDLIWRLMIWLTICVIAYFALQIPGVHLIASITLAWLIAATPFAVNFAYQHQQITKAFPNQNGFINNMDESAYQLAHSIKMAAHELKSKELGGDKFIIIGPQNFINLRLFYHLTELNVAIRTLINPDDETQNAEAIYILANDHLKKCNQSDQRWLNKMHLTLRYQAPDFCLVTKP